MQVQAIFVGAFLPTEEELAELGCSEGSTNEPVVVHELIDCQDGLRAVAWAAESDVARVGWPTAAAVVDIIGVDDHLLDFAILAKQVERAYF